MEIKEKHIRINLTVVIVFGILWCAAPPLLTNYDSPTALAGLAPSLLKQYMAAWVVSLIGIGVLIFYTFIQPPEKLPYEMLNAQQLVWLVVLLIYLGFAYLVLGFPLPDAKEEIVYLHPVSVALSGLIAGGLSLAALWKNKAPRALLILLLLYQMYFAGGIFVTAFLGYGEPLTLSEFLQWFQGTALKWLVAGVVLVLGLGLAALGTRHSALEQVFHDLKRLKAFNAASKEKAESKAKKLKSVYIVPELTEVLTALDPILRPPPPKPPAPPPDEVLKKMLIDLDYKLKEIDLRKEYALREETLDALVKLIATQKSEETGQAEPDKPPPPSPDKDNKDEKKAEGESPKNA
jgi:hypothetical protein